MRNILELHPRLQEKAAQLKEVCGKQGISILYSECLRTREEQDALYAQGRTKPGSIVTNAKGSTYSSQHQWGIAIDFYIDMDVDGDGNKKDDAFNNSTGLFDKVGQIAKSIGLGWGGDWTSIKDTPHLYLPDWGSTTAYLKQQYGTPERFMQAWKNEVLGAVTAGAEIGAASVNYNKTLPAGIILKKGSKGTNVGILQAALNRLMDAGLAVDLDFGAKTYDAVVAFQEKYSVGCGNADGIVGAKTISAVNTLLNGGTVTAPKQVIAQPPQVQPLQVQQPKEPVPAPVPKKTFNQHIRDLQWALNEDGFKDANSRKLIEDGIWGTNTATAVAKVCLSVNTIQRYTNVTAWVQCRVGAYVDGLYGNGTKEAVRAFQAGHGLTEDGIAGNNTITELVKAYAPGSV